MSLVHTRSQTSSKAIVGLISTRRKLVSEHWLCLCTCPRFCCLTENVVLLRMLLKKNRNLFYDQAFLSLFIFLPFFSDPVAFMWSYANNVLAPGICKTRKKISVRLS